MSTPVQPLTLLVVAIAGWLQRDHQAAIVYLLEENKILKARLCGRKLRLTDDERRRLAVKGKALGRVLPPSSVGEMTLRLYGALDYSRNSVRDLRFALNGA